MRMEVVDRLPTSLGQLYLDVHRIGLEIDEPIRRDMFRTGLSAAVKINN